MLGTLELSKKSDVLPLVRAYNATRHDTTGSSPFYLTFGHRLRLSIDAFFGLYPSVESGNSQLECKNKLQKRLGFAYKNATEEATRQSAKYKVYYDQKVRESKLEVSDKVLCLDPHLN